MKLLLIFLALISFVSGECQRHGLDYYFSHARNNSPLLADYKNQMQSAQVDSQMIRASQKVQVNGVSANFYAPVISGYGYDNIITNGAQVSAFVQANKNIISSANLASQYETVRLLKESIGNTAQIAEKDLRKTITTQYITVYGDFQAWAFSREILNLYQSEESILKSLTQSGVYKQADYLTFYVSYQQQMLLVRQSEIQFRNDCATLNYMSGIVDTSLVELEAPDLQTSMMPDIINSPFYRQYTLDSLSLVNQQKTILYTYKPRVNVYADAGYNSSLQFEPYKNFGLSAGLNFSVPIYDGKQRRMKYQKINIAEDTRQHYKDYFLRQYNQQIAQLSQQLRSTESLIGDINGQIKYSRTLIDVNRKLLETGEVRITDLILTTNTYLNARNLLNQNFVNRMQIINQINYWQTL
ncbi:MAG TPA: TolC family protein [Puia sp.]|nr:TolC family protein [Puia sp.]